MSYQVQSLNNFSTGNFIALYGRPSSGKTHFIGTFPKLIVVAFGDKGLNTIKNKKGDYIEFVNQSSDPKNPTDTYENLIDIIHSLKQSPYETIAFDTFGVYVDRMQRIILDKSNKKSMTQGMWGDLNIQIKMVLDAMKELAESKWVIVTFHENTEALEGYEEELTPSVGVFASPGVKKFLYGTANYALHTFIYNYLDPNTQKAVPLFAMHIGTHPYYWTKFQTDNALPEYIFDPSYDQFKKLVDGQGGNE